MSGRRAGNYEIENLELALVIAWLYMLSLC